jgi:hypothetical protein
MSIRLKSSQKLKTIPRFALVAGGISILTFVAYLSFVVYTTKSEDSLAGKNELLINDKINNGEIVAAFSWDQSKTMKAEIGEDAVDICINAETTFDGVDSTFGLSAGNTNKDINLKLKSNEAYNADGIDISIDYRKLEPSGNFYTRGNTFNFGMSNGKVTIKYKVTGPNGKSYIVNETTKYEIPDDNEFRNYRFLFNPSDGKADILVNKISIWSNQAPERSKLTWESDEPVIIGSGMNGAGKAISTFDNLVIRRYGTSASAPMKLLSFTTEIQGKKVMLNWFTANENGTDYFKIERSTDTKNFEEIGQVKASGNSATLKAYALLDDEPLLGVSYYRLSLNNNSTKSVWMPVIAIRLKPEMLTNKPTILTEK